MTSSQDTKPLDPLVLAFVRALARADARRDREEAIYGKRPSLPPQRHRRRASKTTYDAVFSVPDGQGGYRTVIPDQEGFELFKERLNKVIEDLRAGRDDEFGISKLD